MSGQLQVSAVVPAVVDAAAGEAAKAQGMAQAEASTPLDWVTKCDIAIAKAARMGVPFQAADLVAWGLLDEEPPHSSQWGPRFTVNAKRGVIEHYKPEPTVPSDRVTVHRSLCRQWIGTHPTEEAA